MAYFPSVRLICSGWEAVLQKSWSSTPSIGAALWRAKVKFSLVAMHWQMARKSNVSKGALPGSMVTGRVLAIFALQRDKVALTDDCANDRMLTFCESLKMQAGLQERVVYCIAMDTVAPDEICDVFKRPARRRVVHRYLNIFFHINKLTVELLFESFFSKIFKEPPPPPLLRCEDQGKFYHFLLVKNDKKK